jgi:hypothetical protein
MKKKKKITNKETLNTLSSMSEIMRNFGIELNVIANALYYYIDMNNDIDKFKEYTDKKENKNGE